MTRNAVVTTRITRTHPPGDAHLRVKAPPAPPRPVRRRQHHRALLMRANGSNSFFRMENESDLVNIWKEI